MFFMFKGDMCLKIVEKGVHKDVNIKEGEVTIPMKRSFLSDSISCLPLSRSTSIPVVSLTPHRGLRIPLD